MRFRTNIQNNNTFTKFIASLSSLGNVAWLRLSNTDVRFTIIPEQGTQVWSQLAIDTIFDPNTYTIQSASADNVINLEVPLPPLLKALRSASNATSASLRLTKKEDIPWLCMTINTSFYAPSNLNSSTNINNGVARTTVQNNDHNNTNFASDNDTSETFNEEPLQHPWSTGKETTITLDIPIRVLASTSVSGLHEPTCRDPEVHILLPPLSQLKAITDRFQKLAIATSSTNTKSSISTSLFPSSTKSATSSKDFRLEMSATMHGHLRLGFENDRLRINSVWRGLDNPELDPGQVEGGVEGVRKHPSTRMREVDVTDLSNGWEGEGADWGEERGLESGWASVRIDGRDWGRVLSVGRLGGRVIACFCHDHALILYVYVPTGDDSMVGNDTEESVLTYYVSSYAT